MKAMLIPAAFAATSLSLTAQEDHFTSSPRGFESTEGNLSFDLIGSQPQLRYQQIDATNGHKDCAFLSFRRDGMLPDNLSYQGRTVDMEIVMSESLLALASPHMPANYLANMTTVFARKQVAFPDWSAAPAIAPAPSDLVLALDTVWTYPGKAAGTDFLWEVRVYGTSDTNSYPMDGDTGIPSSSVNYGIALGPDGCTPAGGSTPSTIQTDLYNWRTKLSMDVRVRNSAPLAPATLFLAGADAALSAPGLLCTTLHALPAPPGLSLPIGATSASGAITLSIDPIAYRASLIGAALYTQAAVLDPSQMPALPLALTNGNRTTIPSDPPQTSQVVHMYTTQSATFHHSAAGVVNGGIIIHTNHL